ncbi:hypothetical protein GOBAR_DD33348 [Gossypium barbadense]|nr:hypothetical protein GOBAR_DD33348 [Gossypium barbadense]
METVMELSAYKDVWRVLSLQNIMMNQSEDFVQWLTWVIEQLNPCQGRFFCCALWAIWGDRNKRVHEGKVSNGKEIANFINSYIIEITGFEKKDPRIIKENRRWTYPQWEFIKINFDGTYKESQNRSASGIVARDSEGKVLLSCSEIHNDVLSAFAAKVIACWKAIQVGIEKGWQSLIFEGDSLAIIKKCSTKETLRRGEEIYLEMGVPEYVEDQTRYDGVSEPD